MKIGTIAGGIGTTTTLDLTYLPAMIHFVTATVPTAVKVNVLGDGVITDLDGAGIAAISRRLRISGVTNGFGVALASGIVIGKNVQISITNATADAFDLYGYSEAYGMAKNNGVYVKSLQQKVFANSGDVFTNFAEMSFPSLTVNDQLDVTYRSGFIQKMSPADLRWNLSYDAYIGNDVSDFRLPNRAQISQVVFIPALDEQVYIVKYAPIGNL